MNRDFARLTRKDFLRLATLGGLVLGVPFIRMIPMQSPSSRVLQRSAYAMGTTVTISVEDTYNPNDLDTAVGNAFTGIAKMAGRLTRFDPAGQVSALNLKGDLPTPSSDLVTVVNESLRFSADTEGAFDITVKPALDLFTKFLSGGPGPTEAEFEAAQRLIDFERVQAGSGSLSLADPGMSVTLDGIAPGYILDNAATGLRRSGVKSALVQSGGTIVAIGSRSDGSPWKIGIRDPTDENAIVGTLLLKDQAVATTGDYENYFTPDKSYYHVVDPFTARSPLFSHSATVVAPDALTADSLGVALMVRDPVDGLRVLDHMKDTECFIYARDGSKVRSAGLELV